MVDSVWPVPFGSVRVLGDDIYGPHSTAIIVGRRTVIGCAHSLSLVEDESKHKTRSSTEEGATWNKYVEDYWIQRQNEDNETTHEGSIHLILYKFNMKNDWAVFERADGGAFDSTEIATIADTFSFVPFQPAVVSHCTVSQMDSTTKPEEYSIACSYSAVHMQASSSHHLKYEGRGLVRGSSGGGVFLRPNVLVGMHIESISDDEFHNADFTEGLLITPNSKLTDSDTMTSLSARTNGQGSALIIYRFADLMKYILSCEGELASSKRFKI